MARDKRDTEFVQNTKAHQGEVGRKMGEIDEGAVPSSFEPEKPAPKRKKPSPHDKGGNGRPDEYSVTLKTQYY